ncbi:murein L,D-transpeptidase [Algoriphagus sp. AK58]|uniref:L,D-transpeptidase family protein n=1 Tax=Algoriphagus sp. AK58 TaxID=1406877 RepID=UPI00164F56D9|nr:L,D-transpeptidase family protein [Algoriphagus sp. AK58]MBC6368782.1 murein L,D-transpeptidase [Algoriphagus sp. AK58]
MSKSFFLTVFLVIATLGFCTGYPLFRSSTSDQLRLILEQENPGKKITVRGITLHSTPNIYVYYDDRNYDEAWSVNGILTEQAYELRFEIRQSKFDGLNPSDYHIGLIDSFFKTFEANKKAGQANDYKELADLDLLLTDAFFKLASHLERGKVDPSQLTSSWEISRKPQKADYVSLLNRAIQENSVRKKLEELYPDFTIYRKGREVIRTLDELKKSDTLDWKPIKIDKAIKPGDTHSAIPAIRQRLRFWGHLKSGDNLDSKLYDSVLVAAVKSFQKENGMEPDGAIGKNTVSGFNASPSFLMDKAAINLERLRWLPDTVRDAEFILVNIANFQLDYVNKLDTVFSSKVIVGKSYHQSPIFSAQMSYIVFSPYWNIPVSIAKNEVIPAIRKNPNYLQQKNMEVVTPSGKLVDPSTINWSSKSFPYMIRQKPGGSNSLGLVKFMFPNSHSVYIHDTPSKSLFEKEDRALSHGCIRLQNPVKFAQILLKDDPTWTLEKIEKAMHQEKEQIVNLPRKIPVVLIYLTFWADSKGTPHFRSDIYGRDGELLKFLRN